MNGMFDDSDKEWLDLKFGNVIKEIQKTTVKNTTDIIVIEKKVDKLVDFKDTHIEHHEAMEAIDIEYKYMGVKMDLCND